MLLCNQSGFTIDHLVVDNLEAKGQVLNCCKWTYHHHCQKSCADFHQLNTRHGVLKFIYFCAVWVENCVITFERENLVRLDKEILCSDFSESFTVS